MQTKTCFLTLVLLCCGQLLYAHPVLRGDTVPDEIPDDSLLLTVPDSLLRRSELRLDSTIEVDTLKDQDAIVLNYDEDAMLLHMIAQQSEDIRQRDSLFRDSLLNDLRTREQQLEAELQHVRDSILDLRADELAQAAFRDSMARIQREQDSVAQQLAQEKRMGQITVSRSLIKDTEEDIKEMQRNRKNIYSPWRMDALVQIQMAQSYISKNWYQGGNELNLNLLSVLKGNINYSKNNLVWENYGEWRTGFANTPGDTLRMFNVNDDQFRIYTKVGYQIAKNLYVSSSADFRTSIWNMWKPNTRNRKTAFGTPIRFNLDLGLDYKPVANLSIVLSPASYKMVYAMQTDSTILVTDYGIPAGKNILNDIGSSLRIKYKYTPLREIVLETEFYFYTNYKKVEIDWQTTCNFIINRFMTARVSLHPRFDNTYIASGETKAKLQFKELLSVGFSHTFR
ncbi:MAG: DUF3078 domain-containing protein [Paludibacteraceae bacterium]|nr:DUF3078 domain-containing protein [Paludibacteraceae bacterium]